MAVQAVGVRVSSSALYKIYGDVAKWSKAGVCNTLIRRFESARRLQASPGGGMVDAADLKSVELRFVRVRVSPWAFP